MPYQHGQKVFSRQLYLTNKSEDKIPVYRFPKDPEQRRRWIAPIPNFAITDVSKITKHMGICRLLWGPNPPMVKVWKPKLSSNWIFIWNRKICATTSTYQPAHNQKLNIRHQTTLPGHWPDSGIWASGLIHLKLCHHRWVCFNFKEKGYYHGYFGGNASSTKLVLLRRQPEVSTGTFSISMLLRKMEKSTNSNSKLTEA